MDRAYIDAAFRGAPHPGFRHLDDARHHRGPVRKHLELRAWQIQETFAKKDKGKPLHDHEICIDVTAGPKTFSIAGAIVTLNRDLKLSYVSTEGITAIFNAEIGTADSLTRTLRIR
jgi:hypothetical protein